ncbi:MAG TPA: universal stress protein, partial [Hyphomicrobiales bacterium]|nr:universal stress protein [Hyphomicrobiales bacterium]
VVGLKDSGGDMTYFLRVHAALRSRRDFSLLIGPEMLLAEAVLFGAARPLLVVPLGFAAAAEFPRIVVGWDGSQPAARALVAARPFLRSAAHVEVVAVDHPVDEAGDICTEPVTYLARHDIAAQSVHIASDGDGIGMALSRHVEVTGSNLLVMGGFGKSRFREFVLGGATRQMLRAMPVPVLMAH